MNTQQLINILLISSSKYKGGGYLDHFEKTITDFLAASPNIINRIVFVPYAASEKNWDSYTKQVQERFAQWNISVVGIHTLSNNIADEKAIFVGGGNTFRLLYYMQKFELMTPIRKAVLEKGVLYIGASAGTNLACPTIKNSNDMAILYPPRGLKALGLIDFQINPHYFDSDPTSIHMGETREQRISEFHEEDENQFRVVGLREGSFILINESCDYYQNKHILLGGGPGAQFFFPQGFSKNIEGTHALKFTKNSVFVNGFEGK